MAEGLGRKAAGLRIISRVVATSVHAVYPIPSQPHGWCVVGWADFISNNVKFLYILFVHCTVQYTDMRMVIMMTMVAFYTDHYYDEDCRKCCWWWSLCKQMMIGVISRWLWWCNWKTSQHTICILVEMISTQKVLQAFVHLQKPVKQLFQICMRVPAPLLRLRFLSRRSSRGEAWAKLCPQWSS